MGIEIEALAIPEVKLITPKRFGDHRGFFSETYNKRAFQQAGIEIDFVQDNHSLSAERGTMRGLHYQSPPFAQDKLVRVIRGAHFDFVRVDLYSHAGNVYFGELTMTPMNGCDPLQPAELDYTAGDYWDYPASKS